METPGHLWEMGSHPVRKGQLLVDTGLCRSARSCDPSTFTLPGTYPELKQLSLMGS